MVDGLGHRDMGERRGAGRDGDAVRQMRRAKESGGGGIAGREEYEAREEAVVEEHGRRRRRRRSGFLEVGENCAAGFWRNGERSVRARGVDWVGPEG